MRACCLAAVYTHDELLCNHNELLVMLMLCDADMLLCDADVIYVIKSYITYYRRFKTFSVFKFIVEIRVT
jgi:hypothetical protein